MSSTFCTFRYSALACALCVSGGVVAQADTGSGQSIGDAMVAYLGSQVNSRVGGGESSHLATEALRVGGGEFVSEDLGADSPTSGDKVWGTLVTVISNSTGWSDSNPGNACLPGDVIQFGSAVIGNNALPSRFTAVVAAVNGSGRPTSAYVQNLGGNRTVQCATLDVTQLSSGWLRIYRPIARIDRLNEWKFTVVNNDAAGHEYELWVGIDTVNWVWLTAANTAYSYRVHVMDTDGTVPNLYMQNGTSFFVEVAKGNELVNSSDNGLTIDQLSP